VKRKRFSEEQIVKVLQEGERGRKTPELCRVHGISEQTYYRWRRKYGGMGVSDAKRLRQVEDENRRLKKLVADLSLDKEALQDALSRKW
jgi:putative transposase